MIEVKQQGREILKKWTLALIAHDSRKEDMIRLMRAHYEELAGITLVATRSTGQLVAARTKLPVTLVQSGPFGGDQQIGAMVANEEIDAVIFLRDPLTVHPHEPPLSSLLRICDVYNVPLATNTAAAEAVLHLISEHPEALHGHHLAAEYLDNIATVHN